MASKIPVQRLFSKLSNFTGAKIKKKVNRSSFQNRRQL
jgi:hypothetical protein